MEEDLKKIDPTTIDIVWKIMEITRERTIKDIPTHKMSNETETWLKDLDGKYNALKSNQDKINKAFFGDEKSKVMGMEEKIDIMFNVFTGATFTKKLITWGVGIAGASLALFFSFAKLIKWLAK